MTPPRIVLSHRYRPRVCAGPDCNLPPHITWLIVADGTVFDRDWTVGDEMHLCGIHESLAAALDAARSAQ